MDCAKTVLKYEDARATCDLNMLHVQA